MYNLIKILPKHLDYYFTGTPLMARGYLAWASLGIILFLR